jgi:hypothetical protein
MYPLLLPTLNQSSSLQPPTVPNWIFVLTLGHSPIQLLFVVSITLPAFGFHLDNAKTRLPFLFAFNSVIVVRIFLIYATGSI